MTNAGADLVEIDAAAADGGLGTVGIWTAALDRQPAAVARSQVRALEELGYGAIWVGEARRREAFANAALLLSAGSRIAVATGIANIWVRDAHAMRAGQLTLSEAYPGRFVLGIGVSHAPMVAARGHQYDRPLAAMRTYLDAMEATVYEAPQPSERPRLLLAALGPAMLQLAGERTDGAHPYFVPVEHTQQARAILGEGQLLCPEQAVVLESDPARARAIARQHTAGYLKLANYRNNLIRLGFAAEELEGGGSDHLVDAIVAWGEADALVGRIREHLAAGADHVAVQVLTADPSSLPTQEWQTLAGELDREGLLG